MPTRSSSLSSSNNNSDNSSSNSNSNNNNNASNKAIPTVAFMFFTAVVVSIASLIVMNKSLILSFSSSSSSSSSSSPPITTGRRNIINHNKVSADGGRLIVTTEDEEPDSVTFNNNNKNENKNNIKTKNENKEVEKSISSTTVTVADDTVTTKKSENKGRGGATKNKINNNNKKKDTKSGRNEKVTATTIEELDDDDADDGCNIKENKMAITTLLATTTTVATTIKEEGSNLQLPLRPPYYILQIGEPRSGSTFQAQLLMAITDLKSKGTTTETETSTSTSSSSSSSTNTVLFRNSPNPNMRKQQKANKNIKENGNKHRTNQIYQGKDFFQQILNNGFVQKSHDSDWIEKTICELEKVNKHNHIAVFNSVVSDSDNTKNNDDGLLKKYKNLNYDIGYTAHQQIMKSTEFRNCSLCEIDNYYQPIFDLSTNEITILKLYMSKYQLIRQCCGLQMSKYNRLRLHGCNVTEYQNNPFQHSYPWCEKHNMNDIEMEFDMLLKNNNMIYRSMDGEEDSKWTWMKLGDCQKFDEQIISGMDFNGARFDGNCTSLDSVDTTNKNFYTRSNNARKKRKEEKNS